MRNSIFMPLLLAAIVLLMALSLCAGAVRIPLADVVGIVCGRDGGSEAWRYIVMQSRLPQAIAAVLCGSALSVSGLMLQTAFSNPLAGPSIFGINSGAALGVALVMLALGGGITAGDVSLTGYVAVLSAAFAGAMAVMVLLIVFSSMVRDNVMLLIVGIMIGYVASSAIALLNFFATQEGVQQYMIWGMGSFGSVSMRQVPLFAVATVAGLVCAMLMIKPLNALLLGERYAANLGYATRRVRTLLLVITGFLTAVATAFCGPVAFIGLVVPHITRLFARTDNHLTLLPATMLMGAVVALACNVITVLPGDGGVVPLGAVTPLIGAPVIIYILIKHRK